jgi:hypothetical protein
MRNTRGLIAVVGALLLVFGLACLNYTKADGLEHHQEAARRYGLPPPSPPILYGGVAAVVVGAGLVGYAFGVGKRGGA